jgi:hypothetical protein
MNASRPEADTEYSRAHRSSGAADRPRRGPDSGAPLLVLVAALAGAALLIVAEFTPLLHVHSSAYGAGIIKTIQTGSNHSYALIPIALLAAALALVARTTGSRLALAAIGLLALVALGIALLHDLPDAQASGLIGQGNEPHALASSTASTGLYLETLGAVVLLLAAGGGLLLAPSGVDAGETPRRGQFFLRRRSAS